jgi:hypothetical protein
MAKNMINECREEIYKGQVFLQQTAHIPSISYPYLSTRNLMNSDE